ncbi:Na+/H+ antiporter subunit E [Nocardioides zeae]|uniref:Na+/H+ antiporter subunit E n=1 Tax=Nocardioides imazamoxiresistens TaxID=3231893 RepID=A0ABU3PVY3_9ACTN|nr:Na+/H+ antiporter subunit E [Nocardioides zeae]MDT9593339.1 Na+/H+ antiporter subunit E [Nocardioides zeae]
MSPQMRTTRSGKQRLARYRAVQWPMVLLLALVWWVLWGTYTPFSLLGGVVVAVLVCLVFPLPPLRLEMRLRPWPLVVLVARFHFDIVVASVQVAWTTLFPPKPLTNALVGVRLRSESDFVLTVVAELVSLVPGSVVVEVHRGTHSLFVHAIDVRNDDDVEAVRQRVLAQEKRVVDAFGDFELSEEVPS